MVLAEVETKFDLGAIVSRMMESGAYVFLNEACIIEPTSEEMKSYLSGNKMEQTTILKPGTYRN